LVAAQFVLLAVLVFVPPGREGVMPGIVRSISLVLRVAGLVVIAGGAVKLGRSLSVHPKPPGKSELKTDGLYRHVRHPIYSGVLLLAAGIALTSGNPVSLTAFILLVPVIIYKARFEERLLRQRFPDYDEYARRTPAFIPRPGGLFL